MKRFLLFFSFLLMNVAITSCSLFSPIKNTYVANYRLTTVPSVASRTRTHATLLVLHPSTTSVYNTTKMAYSTHRYQVAYFAKNHWIDTPANMLQQLIIETLQNSHHYKAVVTPPYTGQYDYVLNTELMKFEQDFTENPSYVTIELRAQLINAKTNRVIRAKDFVAHAVAPQNSPYGGVVAGNEATEKLLRNLARFAMI